MLKDIPYSLLKQDGRAYEIMLLRDQYDNTFTDIAKEFGISPARAVQIYNKIKRKQRGLYINHILFVLGHENTAQIRKIFDDVFECYQDKAYAYAYLEKKYSGVLTEYRGGEPGMPTRFLIDMPPFKPQLSQEAIARVIEMRESEKASFVAIAKELDMTQAKAKHTYDSFYHKKVLALIKELQAKARSSEEKRAIWDDCFKGSKSPKGRYDILIEKQAISD